MSAVGRRLLPERPCSTQALFLQYLLLRPGANSSVLKIEISKGSDVGFWLMLGLKETVKF